MAKVEAPLFSFDASGRMGPITYVKGGVVRKHTDPANPQTAAQMNQRQKMLAAGKAVTILGPQMIESIKQNQSIMGGNPASNWASVLIGKYVQSFNVFQPDWDALVTSKGSWNNNAAGKFLQDIALPNADAPIFNGRILHNLASVLMANGLDNGILDLPSIDDADTINMWCTYMFT